MPATTHVPLDDINVGYWPRSGGLDAEHVAVERDLLHVQLGNLAAADRLAAFCAENPQSPEAAMALEALIEGRPDVNPERFVPTYRVNQLRDSIPPPMIGFRGARSDRPR